MGPKTKLSRELKHALSLKKKKKNTFKTHFKLYYAFSYLLSKVP